MSILIVDDEVEVGNTIKLMLNRLGYASQAVSSGREALSQFAQSTFDLVLTDLGMPGMSGLELAQRLKLTAPDVRIVLITGWPVEFSPQQLNDHGIESVVRKPVELEDLRSLVVESGASGGDETG